jgi:hypothetical protein
MHEKRIRCRLCDSGDLACVLSLTPTPPANALVGKANLGEVQPTFPLDIYRCSDCFHIQLLDVIEPNVLFSHYLYVSSTSGVMVDYLRRRSVDILEKVKPKSGDLVVEFGSNDGTFLRFFKDSGLRTLGIDPAENLQPRDLDSWVDYFNLSTAEKVIDQHGKAKIICALNVFAHIDDLQDVVRGVELLLEEDGVFIFEVGYLLNVYQNNYFDTIYHEHLDYHHVAPLDKFFTKFGLTLTHVENSDIQGGSLIGYVKRSQFPKESSVGEFMDREEKAGLNSLDTYVNWAERIKFLGEATIKRLRAIKKEGKKIVAYGAPAKATTLMYHFQLDDDLIDFIVDDNPRKQGLFTPGLNIPVVAPDKIYDEMPDYILILAWNFHSSIIAKHEAYKKRGGKFIVPLPELVEIE